jgi:hypothetical protein
MTYYFETSTKTFSQLFENMYMSDYIIISNDAKEIKCHKLIVSSIPYFKLLFSNDYCDNKNRHDLDIPEFFIRAIIRYLYCGDISFTNTKQIINCYRYANFLCYQELENILLPMIDCNNIKYEEKDELIENLLAIKNIDEKKVSKKIQEIIKIGGKKLFYEYDLFGNNPKKIKIHVSIESSEVDEIDESDQLICSKTLKEKNKMLLQKLEKISIVMDIDIYMVPTKGCIYYNEPDQEERTYYDLVLEPFTRKQLLDKFPFLKYRLDVVKPFYKYSKIYAFYAIDYINNIEILNYSKENYKEFWEYVDLWTWKDKLDKDYVSAYLDIKKNIDLSTAINALKK